jgi:hypothetical protein
MKSKEETLALLIELGLTKDEVAAKLVSLGIQGDQKERIAHYLVDSGIEVEDIIATTGSPHFRAGFLPGTLLINNYWYPLNLYPQLVGVHNFISDFDFNKPLQYEVEPK